MPQPSPWIAILIASAALVVSSLAYRLSRRSKLQERPYLVRSYLPYGTFIGLSGDKAVHWEITAVRLLWPLDAQFVKDDPVRDEGGSITQGRLVGRGRVLRGEGRNLAVATQTPRDSAFALVSWASKTSPRERCRAIIRLAVTASLA